MTGIEIHNAKLPTAYVAARTALARCEKIDECKTWKDKAAALASYAKQADDDELFKTAMRIKGRAVRRMGELLKTVEPKHTGRIRAGADPNSETRKSVAEQAGISARQTKDALRVAAIPAKQFEKAIEADRPPTVTELARLGSPTTPSSRRPSFRSRGATAGSRTAGPTGATRGGHEGDRRRPRPLAP